MALLHNRISQQELREALFRETISRTTLSFYRYFPINNPQVFRDEMYQVLFELQVFGRIYIAQEGINAQISLPTEKLEAFKNYLNLIPGLEELRLNIAVDDGKSFWVLKIKVREKIVADGIADPEFSMLKKGRYVNAEEFNRMTADPETLVIDMRNHYEYEVGHFQEAIEVPSDTFREQLPMAVEMLAGKEEKNIIMYCTGGIRCEKASAYLLHHGFINVHHLEGGIIEYANVVKAQGFENKFVGKNFVFDERLGEKIGETMISSCHQCGSSADTHTNCKNSACHLLFIQCAECARKYNGCCSRECHDVLLLPEDEQKELRKGVDKGRMVFNKSKERRITTGDRR